VENAFGFVNANEQDKNENGGMAYSVVFRFNAFVNAYKYLLNSILNSILMCF